MKRIINTFLLFILFVWSSCFFNSAKKQIDNVKVSDEEEFEVFFSGHTNKNDLLLFKQGNNTYNNMGYDSFDLAIKSYLNFYSCEDIRGLDMKEIKLLAIINEESDISELEAISDSINKSFLNIWNCIGMQKFGKKFINASFTEKELIYKEAYPIKTFLFYLDNNNLSHDLIFDKVTSIDTSPKFWGRFK